MRKLAVLVMIFSMSLARSAAQPETLDAGYDIGFDCPVAQTLDPGGDVLWVLIQGCYITPGYSLRAFNVSDGTPVEVGSDFAAELQPLTDVYIDRFTNPVAFIDDHTLSIRYSDAETYAPRSVILSLDGETAAAPAISDEALGDLLSQYTEYPEAAVYNADHTQAAVVDASDMVVLDLTTREVVFSLPLEPESYNAYPSFSLDGQTVYVAQLDDSDDVDNYAATLSSYSLPDGSLISRSTLPSFLAWVSPDGRHAAVEGGSNDGTTSTLSVLDLTDGSTVESFSLYEPPSQALTCVNDGRDLSDVDFPRSGKLRLVKVDWLPDSSGIVFTRSYGGEGAGGGRPCVFDYSRLNRVDLVTGGEG